MTEHLNPYSPPQSDIAIVNTKRAMVRASRGRRFGTLLVDYALFILLAFCIGIVIALLFGEEGIKMIQSIPDIVLGFPIFFMYYIFFEGIWARTPGKLLFGTVVVTESGTKPSIKQVIGRTLCRFIPFEAFSCLGERGWHDSIPETQVVLVKSH